MLSRSRRFAIWVGENAVSFIVKFEHDSLGSLFEGIAGAAAFVADTIDPDHS
jgi:hypothetical protein